MAILMPEGKQSFNTTTGIPLVGGKVYTYDAGTNNPKQTFNDAAGTVPNANPVILDARGEATIFWSGAYKVVLKDALDNTIWTVDNIISIDVATQTQITALSNNLANIISNALGPALVGLNNQLRYPAATLGAKANEIMSVWDFMTTAQINDVRAGTFAQDVTVAMNTAATFCGTTKRALFVPAGGYKLTAPWVVPIKVYVLGESPAVQNSYDPAGTWDYGTVLYKAHTGNCLTKTGVSAYQEGAPIENICISSHRTNFPGGNGIVIDKCSNVHLIRCTAFSVGGDCFVLGVSAGDVTGHNYTFNCYSNNPVGVHYRIRSKWSRHLYPVTDGGTHGMWLDNAPETHVDGFHFEGTQVAAVRMQNANTSTKFTGKGFINLTNPLYNGKAFVIDSFPGNQGITIENTKMLNGSTSTAITFTGALVAATAATLTAAWAGTTGLYTLCFSDGSARTGVTLTNGSAAVAWVGAVTATAAARAISFSGGIAVDLQGVASNDVIVRNCDFEGWDVAINDGGTTGTIIQDNLFYGNRLAIQANSQNTQYTGNNIRNTLGGWSIDHIGFPGGTTGIWTQNFLDKPIKPTQTGVAGNFGNNQVYGNKGYKTSSMVVTGGVPSPAVVPHGLAGIPQYINYSVYSGAPTNMIVSAADATNVTISWGGGGNCQICVRSALLCENQL